MAKKKAKKVSKTRAKKVVKKRKASLQPQAFEKGAMPVFAKEEMMSGRYCNIAIITHTEREFVFDFFFAISNQNSLVSRIITNPQHTKKIYEVLGGNIKQYEKKFGKIKI